jgi:hypothetical protein
MRELFFSCNTHSLTYKGV